MSWLSLSDSIEYLCYGSTAILNLFFQCVARLYTSEYDVYRYKTLTYKDSPRSERVKTYVTTMQDN